MVVRRRYPSLPALCDDTPRNEAARRREGAEAMARMSGARAFVAQLRREGVRFGFTVPGESFLGVLDALRDEPDFTLVAARHEGGAGFMAEAVGKLTGTPALCMATRGVGSANMAIALHTAHQDSTPLIALIGQVETEHRQKEAFQEVELAPLFGHLVKWAVEVHRTDRLPALLHEAARRAVSGRPGPVLLAVPTDVLNAEHDFTEADFRPRAVPPRPAPAPEDVRTALDLLLGAERPAILAGGGVIHAGATGDLVRLSEATGIPVMVAFRRYHAFPNDHGRFLGGMGLGASPTTRKRLADADTLLALGTRLGEFTTGAYALPAPGTSLIHADISPDVVGTNNATALGVVSDAGIFARALLAAYTERDDPRRPARVAATERDREAFVRATTPPPTRERPARRATAVCDPTGIVADLMAHLPSETILTGDAGNHWSWFGRYFRFRAPYLGPTSGAMGYAVPGAVGAALASPGTSVLAVVGDGGALMTGTEIETAVRFRLPVLVLVFNNRSYATIRMHQEREFPRRVAATDLGPVDFALFARSLGAWGVRVTRNRDFAPALREASALLAGGTPALIEVATDVEDIGVGQTIAELRGE